MIGFEESITLLTFAVLALFLCGLLVLALGETLPGKGSWLIWVSVLIFVSAVAFDSNLLFSDELSVKIWKAGWVGSEGDLGGITVGVWQDSLSLCGCMLSALVTLAMLTHYPLFFNEPHPHKVYSAVALSLSGVALSWISFTPWLSLVGLMITLLGGFMALGSRWQGLEDASVASRFISERSMGLVVSFLGFCILGSAREPLLLTEVKSFGSESSHVGSVLVLLGSLMQLQPFPFLGWIVSDSKLTPSFRMLLTQIFPAWASFALLFRLDPHFRAVGLFPWFGWIGFIASLFSVVSGLFQKQMRLGLGVWLNGAFSLSLAILAFSGPLSAFAWLVGSSLSALSFSIALGPFQARSETSKNRVVISLLLFLSLASAAGVFGFIGSVGVFRWVSDGGLVSGEGPLFLFGFALFVFLAGRLLWVGLKGEYSRSIPWASLGGLFCLVLLGLGVLWTGSFTGGMIPERADHLFPSLLHFIFKEPGKVESGDMISSVGIYAGVLVASLILAYWTSGRKEDRLEAFQALVPRGSHFIASGYGIDFLLMRGLFGVVWLGKKVETLVDLKLWNRWIPSTFQTAIQTLSSSVSAIDLRLTVGLSEAVRRSVEVPAKILQLIQTGDLRWYLFFSLASGFALLFHFLRF